MSDPLFTALIASILGVIGTIVGVIVSGALKAREARRVAKETRQAAAEEARRTAEEAALAARVAMATSLNHEWHEGKTAEARKLAWVLLRKEWGVRLSDIERKYPEDFTSIWAMLEFFAKLHHENALDALKKEDVVELFGEPIVWWWIVGFSGRADPGEWCSYDAMSKLNDWVETSCRGSLYESDYQAWVDWAKATRKRNALPDSSPST
jgi:hypothetical protein